MDISESKPVDFQVDVSVSGAFLLHGNEFLLLKRQPNKPQGTTWGLPAGKLNGGECPLQGAIREVGEEVGIHLDHSDLQHLTQVYFQTDACRYVFHIYGAQLEDRPLVDLSIDEHSEYRWCTFDEGRALELIHGGMEVLDICEPMLFKNLY